MSQMEKNLTSLYSTSRSGGLQILYKLSKVAKNFACVAFQTIYTCISLNSAVMYSRGLRHAVQKQPNRKPRRATMHERTLGEPKTGPPPPEPSVVKASEEWAALNLLMKHPRPMHLSHPAGHSEFSCEVTCFTISFKGIYYYRRSCSGFWPKSCTQCIIKLPILPFLSSFLVTLICL